MDVGEIKLVISGEKFDKNLPVRGTVILEFPNGCIKKLDIIDIIRNEWYEKVV